MTDLTEQWKKGELEKGKKYWCKLQNGTSEICYLWLQTNHFTYLTGYQSKCLPDEYIEEVLAPVPSYEEWKALNESVNIMIELWRNTEGQLSEKTQLIGKLGVLFEYMRKKNQQLKELLKECRELFEKQGYLNMVDKIDNAIGEKK